MNAISFTFLATVSAARQSEILELISGWPEIVRAGRVKPDASRPEILRMCYAYVKNNTNVEEMLHRLQSVPEIESASLPPERHLH